MHWLKTNLKNSIQAISAWRHPPESAASSLKDGMDEIRNAMLALIGDAQDKQSQQLTRRIRYANEIQALWYLRGDLMAVLAGRHGEAAARQKLQPVTDMFQDLLPRGLRSRPSPLSGTGDH